MSVPIIREFAYIEAILKLRVLPIGFYLSVNGWPKAILNEMKGEGTLDMLYQLNKWERVYGCKKNR